MRLTSTRLLWFTGAVLLGVLWRPVVRFVEVDRCLDRGGRWNGVAATCEEDRRPRLVAYGEAWHGASWVVAGIGVVALIVIFSWRDARRASRPRLTAPRPP